MEFFFEYLNLSRWFELSGVVYNNGTFAGKPAPDIYAHACRELGLDPSETFAVEDSPNGVRSAYRAGCNVNRPSAVPTKIIVDSFAVITVRDTAN